MRTFRTLLFILITLACSLPTLHAQNPAAYAHVSNWTNFAQFSVKGSDRAVLHEKGVTFEVTEPISMTFGVLVQPDGKVKFVRPPRVAAHLNEYRLGGTDALYNFEFAPLASGADEQWVNVEMNIYPDAATRQVQ